MDKYLHSAFLLLTKLVYRVFRFLIFHQDAEKAHKKMLALLEKADSNHLLLALARRLNEKAFKPRPITVGGVYLPYPVILAAGFVKGYGFISEESALKQAESNNIIPGWRIMPRLVGPVEFGSFTPHPRVGNSGKVIWRDVKTQSTQNRIGLRNPGSAAAAQFLAKNRNHLSPMFGINIAPNPGVEDPDPLVREVGDSLKSFLNNLVIPSWFTLNISCPNTEDDPENTQTEIRTRMLCSTASIVLSDYTKNTGNTIPLWVKVSPDLSDDQYRTLIHVFQEFGIKAIIATNTLGMPTPEDSTIVAGVGGGTLFLHTMRVVEFLASEIAANDYDIDIIACGGAMTHKHYQQFRDAGAKAIQYWSTIVYNGPLAGAYLLQ